MSGSCRARWPTNCSASSSANGGRWPCCATRSRSASPGRKVYQEGLAVPVANVASIGLDGSVDFDQNLDLVARFALIPPRSNVPVLTPLMANARFDLPIRGTLKNPKIDGEALKEHWEAIGAGLLGNSMEAGVNGLQRLLQGLPVPGLRGFAPGAARAAAPPAPAARSPDDDGGPPAGRSGSPPPPSVMPLHKPLRATPSNSRKPTPGREHARSAAKGAPGTQPKITAARRLSQIAIA